jgi:SAM-dependent methyltransferase
MDERLQEAIAGAEAYESLHVPALFQEWTMRVLDAVQAGAGDHVLDIACGTGILARSAIDRVGASGHVVGVDPNPGMLAVAGRLDDGIEWRVGTAEDLPCDDDAFDCVVSQFGMMFFNDRAGAIREIVRVLVPGGRFAIAVWDSLENSPAYSAEVALLQRMAGQEAADALRAPFVLGDLPALRRLIEGAAATSVATSTVVGRARFPSIRSMVEADLRGWLPVMGVDLEDDLVLRILAAAEEELAGFVLPDGRMEFASPAHIVSATLATE